MGSAGLERNFRIKYYKLVCQMWALQTPEFKKLCNDHGRPYGYSGMNVFYFFLKLLVVERYGEWIYEPFTRYPK